MTCHQVLDIVEEIAGGDRQVDESTRVHLETCPRCASALATARRIETFLSTRPAPEAPVRFTAAVQQRIRRERWTQEQQVDRIFNVAIGVAALLVIAGGAFAFNAAAILAAASGISVGLETMGAELVRNAQPFLATYAAATGLLVSGLFMWWWAEGAGPQR